MRARALVLGVFGLLVSACGNDDPGISFRRDIAPIFEGRCNICHHPESAIGYELDNAFDPERGIVGRQNSWIVDHDSPYEFVVDPGKPENSSLLGKVRDPNLDPATDGDPMPKLPETLSPEELAVVEQWILDGAKNDASFEATAKLLGTEISLRPSVSGRCTWCHYPGSPTGLNVLDVFDADEGMVNVVGASGGVLVIPGDPENSVLMQRLRGEGGAQMPLHFSPLGEADVQKIVDWIIAGAPNN